jgi:XTP/dITP diphosphohydrolase
MTVLIATRSPHKAAEILQLLPPMPGLALVDLASAGIPASPAEDDIEAFSTFEENALAKARYFANLTSMPVLADDSGLCVDALDGAPGVLSRRFSGRVDLAGIALDQANNAHLLRLLAGRPGAARSAHYFCVVAVATPDGTTDVFRGTVAGLILSEPRGSGGFGYDPLFFVPELGATFAEVPQEVKNRLSHRGRAVQAALPRLLQLADS